jgi:hypothetical protein
MLDELRIEIKSMQVAALARIAERRGWPVDRSAIRANIEAQGVAQAATRLKPPVVAPAASGLFGWTRSLFWRR